MKRKQWLAETWGLAKSIIRILRWSRCFAGEEAGIQRQTICFVLGNGPSLGIDMATGGEILELGDVFCVNQFAESSLYEKIRPNNYVLADPSYWESDESEYLIAMREQLFERMIRCTAWPMTVHVPFAAERYIAAALKAAPSIRVSCYNNVPLIGSDYIVHKLFDRGLGCPEAQNVLIPALFLAIRRGYGEIILLGADHSWHETLVLDERNRVCMKDRHFYNQEANLTPFTMGGGEEKTFTMDALFFALAKMFEGYWRLLRYAEYREVKITNASSVTYIDAFERKAMDSVVQSLNGN